MRGSKPGRIRISRSAFERTRRKADSAELGLGQEMWREALADTEHWDAHTIEQFQAHWRLIQQWNVTSNLTGIVDERHAAWLHYRDSLEACRWIKGTHVIDFGSGAGFPGVVLAIAMPHLHFTLLEPRRLRVNFLEMAVEKLGLTQVTVVRGKTESTPTGTFDHAVTRATFSSSDFLTSAKRWLAPNGSLICYRSPAASAWGHRHAYTLGGQGVAMRSRCLDIINSQ